MFPFLLVEMLMKLEKLKKQSKISTLLIPNLNYNTKQNKIVNRKLTTPTNYQKRQDKIERNPRSALGPIKNLSFRTLNFEIVQLFTVNLM